MTMAWTVTTASVRPAAADDISQCSTTVGEIVVVDFSHWGGTVDRSCDANLTTGYAALYEAGFDTQGTAHDGDDFICRIGVASQGAAGEEPTPAQDDCVDTPAPSASWSYWHADAGQDTWSYSRQGSMEYVPPAGSVDAWVFGGSNAAGTTGQPSFSPNSVRAANTSPSAQVTSAPTPAPAGATPTTTAASPATSAAGAGTVRAVAPVAGGATPSTTVPASGSPTPSSAPPGSASPGTAGPQTVGSTTTTAAATRSGDGRKIVTLGPSSGRVAPASSGSPVPFVVGAAVIALVAAGAVVVARRRRHAGS